MTAMTEDLLDETAVQLNLDRLARERRKGRKFFGVEFDKASKTWRAYLGDTLVTLPARRAVDLMTAPRTSSPSRARRKK